LRGNFYAYKVKALGNVVELLPLNPDIVTPKLKDDWTVEYEGQFQIGYVQTLTQDEIWHVRLFTLDGLNGLNPIAYARQALGSRPGDGRSRRQAFHQRRRNQRCPADRAAALPTRHSVD
jgi:phage portal protein BeeE